MKIQTNCLFLLKTKALVFFFLINKKRKENLKVLLLSLTFKDTMRSIEKKEILTIALSFFFLKESNARARIEFHFFYKKGKIINFF